MRFIEGAVMFIEGAVTFIGGSITFIGEGGLAVGRLFKVVDNIKGVNKRDLRRRLITYKLKGPLLLINSLISISNHSMGLSL